MTAFPLIVILLALVLLFGGNQLPKFARNAGEAMREFRNAGAQAEPPVERVTLSRSELDALVAERAAKETAEEKAEEAAEGPGGTG